jgi:LmbE family N-acetylglucosaminyl deacetylase
VLIVNAGDKGSAEADADPVAVAAARADEVAEATGVLGLAGHEVLGIPDGEAENDVELRQALVTRLRRLRPDAVIAPDPTAVFFGDRYVNHRDHREVGWAVLDACAPMAGSPLYFPDAGEPHQVATLLLAGTLEPDCWFDIEATLDRKVESLLRHASQLGDGAGYVDDVVRARALEAADAAERAGVRGLVLAEGFRRLTLD